MNLNILASFDVVDECPHTGRTTIYRIAECRGCKGTGRTWWEGCDDQDEPCPACDGTGQTAKEMETDR